MHCIHVFLFYISISYKWVCLPGTTLVHTLHVSLFLVAHMLPRGFTQILWWLQMTIQATTFAWQQQINLKQQWICWAFLSHCVWFVSTYGQILCHVELNRWKTYCTFFERWAASLCSPFTNTFSRSSLFENTFFYCRKVTVVRFVWAAVSLLSAS